MGTVKTLNFLFDQHIAAIDAKLAGFEQGLEHVANTLLDVIMDVIPGIANPGERQILIRQVVSIQVQLRGQLNAAGYSELVDKFISGYDESLIFSKTILEAIGNPLAEPMTFRSDTLLQLKNLDMTAFEAIGNRALSTLSRELTLNVLAGKKRSDVIKSMNNVLDGAFVNQGKLYADTAIRSFDRQANFDLFTEAGIDKFRYFGPRDDKNREFCRERVGRIYTLAQLKAMNNGSTQFGAVMFYAGGPRCRHTFQPVTEVD